MHKGIPQIDESTSVNKLRSLASFLMTHERAVAFSVVAIGFATATLSLIMQVHISPSTIFGESIEKVVTPWYWVGLTLMITSICYMLARLNALNWKTPFLLSCVMLIVTMRGVLAIITPLPFVQDSWNGIFLVVTWRKYGLLSPIGLNFLESGNVRAWPLSYLLAYSMTCLGVPVLSFFKWAPTVLFVLEVFAVYFLFKELANERIGMVSSFLFTLLNTNGFLPLHYAPQTLGALLYLVTMFAMIRAYKTRRPAHLAMALASLCAVMLTHHMTTFFVGISLLGSYFSRHLLASCQKIVQKRKLPSLAIGTDTFVSFSLAIAIFTFSLWYFYGFIFYRMDALWLLSRIMSLLTTQQPQYQAGYFGRYLELSFVSQISILVYPVFIMISAGLVLLIRILRKRFVEGYLWLTIGWVGALILAFVFGNIMYGNYIEPLRTLEIITIVLYSFAALLLLGAFSSRSMFRKGILVTTLVVVAFFSVFSIYRAAQTLIYFVPPWWWSLLNPP